MTLKRTIYVDPNDPDTNLTVVANVLLRFRSDRRWIDVKHFAFLSNPDDRRLLATLISHRQFRDAYIGSGPGDHPVHGPYTLAAVKMDLYQSVDAATATRWLDDFCALFDLCPPPCLEMDIDSVVRQRLKHSTTIFRLPLLEGGQHDCGWILEEFRELVIISRDQRELALVVMGID